MLVGVSIETWGFSLVWGQVNRLGVEENYVCCFVIVVIFLELGGTKRYGGLKSSYRVLISTTQLRKSQSLNQFFSLEQLVHY